MIEKDKPSVQRERISDAVREVLSDCVAVFDENAFKNFVRFRIDHKPTGDIVGGPTSEHASVFADYSDGISHSVHRASCSLLRKELTPSPSHL